MYIIQNYKNGGTDLQRISSENRRSAQNMLNEIECTLRPLIRKYERKVDKQRIAKEESTLRLHLIITIAEAFFFALIFITLLAIGLIFILP